MTRSTKRSHPTTRAAVVPAASGDAAPGGYDTGGASAPLNACDPHDLKPVPPEFGYQGLRYCAFCGVMDLANVPRIQMVK